METPSNEYKTGSGPSPFQWLFNWRTARRALIAFVGLITLIALFYTEENWRGKRAWEQCKRELEAQGMVMDWSAYIPKPVPEDQNFFNAPGIRESDWIGRGSHELSKSLSSAWQENRKPMLIAELVIPSVAARERSAGANLNLEDTSVQKSAKTLIQTTLGPSLRGTRNNLLSAKPLDEIRPITITGTSDRMLTAPELRKILPQTFDGSRVQVEPAGTNSFRILLDPPPVSAGDYLRATESFTTDFDIIREALKRPFTQMNGDYSQPFAMPIPNFITMRTVAQLLADRAKCHLLLGRSGKALQELTLLHDLCRVLEAEPTGKPMTLVAAMINVAVTGLYTDTVAEGLSVGAWNEQQLAAIQTQLSGKNLLPDVVHAFQQEPAAVCRSLEMLPSSKWAAMMFFSPPNPTFREQLKNPRYLFISWMPRGWIYQNMVTIAKTHQTIIAGFDRRNGLVLPRAVESGNRGAIQLASQARPSTIVAGIVVPNYVRTSQALAQRQTEVNEAFLACALERYRFAHHEYPETLEALVPQFAERIPHDVIGGQPLKYRRTEADRFLLYSVGWNETDDGGNSIFSGNKGKQSSTEGDWVWEVSRL